MTLRRFNNILSWVVIFLGLYISVSPFLPEVTWRIKKARDDTAGIPYSGKLSEGAVSANRSEAPKENRIVIPSINLNEPIYEGQNIGVINKGGTWRRPNTSEPGEPGNSVIVGHRIYGRGPGTNASTLYHLDRVLPGQKMAIYWEGKEILYEIREKKVVAATAVEIESQTKDQRLTIYTCTPIWTAKDRLVLIAYPVESLL